MRADDTHLTYAGFSADNIQSCLNNDLVNVGNWLIANKLALNMTKTECMLIRLRQRLHSITVPLRPSINGAAIEQVTILLNHWECLSVVILLGNAMLIS